jgi:hypothetical protein
MDDLTFRQLKESKYYHPEITDVILDHNQMLEMVLDAISITEKGYDTVIDSVMFNFLLKYFKHGIDLIDKRIEEKGIKMRMIVDANKENIDFLNAIKFYDIRHIDGIRGNFGIFDNRAYMVFIFHKESEQPDQTLWSNNKILIDKQLTLFDKVWEIAIPITERKKELQYSQIPNYQRQITTTEEIKKEIDSAFQQCRKELMIISSAPLLNKFLNTTDFFTQISTILKRQGKIRILTNGLDNDFINKFNFINNLNLGGKIEYKESIQLNGLDELVILCDSKLVIRVPAVNLPNQTAYLSTEDSAIAVQEILFEKYWNELKSLEIANT